MITKNINGNNISASFISALTSDSKECTARLMLNGSELSCSIIRLTITKGSCGSADAFSIGNVVGSTLDAEVKELSTAVKGKELEVQFGIKVGNAYEYIRLGYFVVSETAQTAYETKITAYGATITKTGSSFTMPATKSLGNIASAIASSASALAGRTITVTFGSGINSSDVLTESIDNMTAYQALEILSACVGGYAVDTYDGNIKIYRFDDSTTLARDTSTMKNLPVVDESDFEITGTVCILKEAYTDDEGTEVPAVQIPATPLGTENLIVENPYMTQALYNSYLNTLTGYEYRPATISFVYGDPRLEGNDVLSITDVNGSVYVVPCHLVTHSYAGGFATQIVSVPATAQENEVATSAGNLTSQLQSIGSNLVSARASAETAKAYAQEAKETTDIINNYAEQAGETVEQILDDALSAGQSAQEALASAEQANESAGVAYNYASVAVNQLGVVENIVGVIDLISKNGTYERTTDTTPQEGKWYFIRTGSGTAQDPYIYQVQNSPTFGYVLTEDTSVVQDKPYYTRSGTGTEADPYVYTQVENPTGNPQSQGYYENTSWNYFVLTGIDNTIQNYVSSHLVLAGNSLYLQTNEGDGSTRLELNTQNGMTLYDQTGSPVAQYGANTIIGNINTFAIKIGESPTYILTDDTAIITNKKYYTRSGSGTTADPYVYTLVDNPVVADIGTYYENVLELGFYQSGERVAYINNNSLYITQTVVLQEMHLGERVENGGLGQWSWCVHPIGGLNNLYLKWLG